MIPTKEKRQGFKSFDQVMNDLNVKIATLSKGRAVARQMLKQARGDRK
jgi:hypothetical protein